MLIGEKETFAIECYRDPRQSESSRYVFGRMCLWVAGNRLGDIDCPACILNVTEAHLQALLHRLDTLDDPEVCKLGDRAAFDFLDQRLYGDDERSIEQIRADAERFRKFDLLTNGGESFDRAKSFIIGDADGLRIVFQDNPPGCMSARIDRSGFIATIRDFLAWVAEGGKDVG